MPRMIKVRCTGPKKHVNEINLDEVLKKHIAFRFTGDDLVNHPQDIPERIVLQCRHCTAGNVILTREMIREALSESD